MPFDWEKLFRAHRVDYVTSGPNVGPNEIGIRCPLCGDADPSHHMGISLSGRGWSCLRNRQHSGKSRARLIKLLLKCSDEEARKLAGYRDEPAPAADDELAGVLGRLRGTDGARTSDEPLTMPPELKPLAATRRMAEPFLEYLRGRGYSGRDLEWVAQGYDLRYATTGPHAWRLIIPVRGRRSELLTWTGRAISPREEVRYKTLSTRPEYAAYGRAARLPTSRTLLGLPLLWGAPEPRALLVCEGPMDALRVSTYGRELGVYGTCLFGLNASEEQAAELEALSARFPRVRLCIDSGEELRRTALLGRLQGVGARPLPLPRGRKDPGELPPREAVDLCLSALA